MRADARRNRDRLLAATGEAFAEHGTDAALEDIARRAGVAIGTLYSHFPTRHALLEALLREQVEALGDKASQLLDHPSPLEALIEWAHAAIAHTATYRGLAASMMTGLGYENSELHAACQALIQAGERVLARAQQAGVVRPDVAASDLFALINAVAWAGEQVPSEQGARLLGYVIDGLRPMS
ncbi:TetR/AcrR family transcriptional regulator [Saccharopolyspora sp. K220]|uniref:TetR/AcrR family transcriptional regulator n=1 Tax=Saccharopolyspora soli TaxID=2926618 RepID=UPI001F58FB61|nr:TetR/AcrR family transcriptional regulator [Saccharopolyspora soli]MCI2417885.1 TetR/AcrR family transcriptional regulator [Saccharopolyspora soli]